MDDNKQTDMLLTIAARVVAFLSGLAVVTVIVRYIVSLFRGSSKWIGEQVRSAIRKEMQ